MTVPTNSLDVLGVPKWLVIGIWADAEKTDNQKAELVLELVKKQYHALMTVLHTDVADDDGQRVRLITRAYSEVEPDILGDIVERWLDLRDLRSAEQTNYAVQQLQRAKTQLRVLRPYLLRADWRQVLVNTSSQELAFGLGNELGSRGDLWKDFSFAKTYLLECSGAGSLALTEAIHPASQSLDIWGDSVQPPAFNDGRWQLYVPDLQDPENPKVIPVDYAGFNPQGRAYLVGGVSEQQMDFMAADLVPRTSNLVRSALQQGPTDTRGELQWLNPEDAWWFGGLEPALQVGDYGVVARGSGDNIQIAVLGRLLASRELPQ